MSDKIYSVAVSCRDSIGWVEYDREAKTVKVCLEDAQAVADAEKFLSESMRFVCLMRPCGIFPR